ncbi:hypothetical protein GSI_07540 [Ganoderma sinense ZZ0214-1]|uniref:FAD-binding domain-containing protein n=1 Tax=Ganoderma sinense ZZ0214-1 TaxID=1077348 RepID=A0A2G8S9C1_9APHY|nr:hypothetical protein GSI_07540 [Ganoderma sinense ZZ0214-1]
MSSDSTAHLHITTIGCGMGGFALLVTLHRRASPRRSTKEIPASTPTPTSKAPPTSAGRGDSALREDGLQESFEKLSRPEADEMSLAASSRRVPHATRRANPFRGRTFGELLLDAIPPHLIHCGHALSSACRLSNGQHKLPFTNGFTTASDFPVGLDGASSHIRPLASQTTPTFLDVNGVEISCAPEVMKLAETVEKIWNGTPMAMQNSCMLGAQINGDGRLHTYAWLRKPELWVISNSAEAKAGLLEHFSG